MFKAPTEKLQSWHQPCPKKLPPKTATEMFSKDKDHQLPVVMPVNMQALMKLPKTKQIFTALNCTSLFIENTIPLPAIVSSAKKTDCLPPQLSVYEIVFLNEHVLGNLDDFIRLENETMEQANCNLWFEARRFRLTASMFHRILHTTSNKYELCESIKKKQNQSLAYIPAVKHDIDMEPVIRKKLQKLYADKLIRKCGFVVNPHFPYLGASPDGIMMGKEPVIIEINKNGLQSEKFNIGRTVHK